MSAKSVEAILSKAMNDAKFAAALLSDPKTALAGFDLTEEETERFVNMSRADLEIYVNASPEERKSFSIEFVNHNQSSLYVK